MLKTIDGKPTEIAKAAGEFKRNISYFIEIAQCQAKLHRAKYLALVEEGFTPAEALELSKLLG
jgi:hypothetical protein